MGGRRRRPLGGGPLRLGGRWGLALGGGPLLPRDGRGGGLRRGCLLDGLPGGRSALRSLGRRCLWRGLPLGDTRVGRLGHLSDCLPAWRSLVDYRLCHTVNHEDGSARSRPACGLSLHPRARGRPQSGRHCHRPWDFTRAPGGGLLLRRAPRRFLGVRGEAVCSRAAAQGADLSPRGRWSRAGRRGSSWPARSSRRRRCPPRWRWWRGWRPCTWPFRRSRRRWPHSTAAPDPPDPPR